jgi:hypothetical protein
MFGTSFIFKRAGSNRKIVAKLSPDRTELWIDKNPIAKYKDPVWLYQREPFVRPEVVFTEVDTAREMANIFTNQNMFKVYAKEFAGALAACCPREYQCVVEYLQRKRQCVMEVNFLSDFEQIVEDIRNQLEKVKEEINVCEANKKAKKQLTRQPNSRSKRATKNTK